MNFAVLADLNATRANCEAFRLALKSLTGACLIANSIRIIPSEIMITAAISARAARTSPSRFITGKRRVSTCAR